MPSASPLDIDDTTAPYSGLSPAAQWLASFSPPSGASVPPPMQLADEVPDADTSIDEASMSPAARYLRSFSSPPPESVAHGSDTPDEIDGYRLGRKLGQGLSEVRLATHTNSGAVVAIKIASSASKSPMSSDQFTRLRNEEQIWSMLSHEYILPLLSVHRSPDLTAFTTLYCPDGSLLDLVTRRRGSDRGMGVEGDLVRSLFRQTCRALSYLHTTMRIVHGDIKLENILIDDTGNVRLADFGSAQYIEPPPAASSTLGTISEAATSQTHLSHHMSLRRDNHHVPRRGRARQASDVVLPSISSFLDESEDAVLHASLPYASPEILRRPSSSTRPRSRPKFQPPQDIWALGCVLHALLTGSLPFHDTYEPRLHLKILNGEWESRSPTVDGDRVVLRGCLRVNPSERWTIDKLEAHAHEVGTADYSKIAKTRASSRAQSKSRSRVRRTSSNDSSSSLDGSEERRRPRDRSTSRVRGVRSTPSNAADGHSSRSHSHHRGADPYPLPQLHYHAGDIAEELEPDNTQLHTGHNSHIRRNVSSESRGGASEVVTPTDDTFLASLSLNEPKSRSRSRGRSIADSRHSQTGLLLDLSMVERTTTSLRKDRSISPIHSRGRRGLNTIHDYLPHTHSPSTPTSAQSLE